MWEEFHVPVGKINPIHGEEKIGRNPHFAHKQGVVFVYADKQRWRKGS